MMMITKMFNLDIKNWIIFILVGLLIISLILSRGIKINKYEDEINKLNKENIELLNDVDSLKQVNSELDLLLKKIDIKLNENNKRIDKSLSILNDLKNKKNEIPNYVGGLSAYDTANALSEYLETRTKSNNNNK
jgi:hypothetical protein